MFCDNCRPAKNEILWIFATITVLLPAAMKKEPNIGLGIVAEAGIIEVPPLRDRETTGIYTWFLVQKQF